MDTEIKTSTAVKKIWSYLKPFRLQVIVGPLAKMTEVVIELLTPFVMGKLIDAVITHPGEKKFFLKIGFILLGLVILGAGFSFLCQFMAATASQGTGTNLRHDLFAKIQNFSFRQLDKFGAISLSNRLTLDVSNIEMAVAYFIRLFFRSPLLIIGSTVAAFIITRKTLVLFLPVIIIVFTLVFLIMSRTIPLQEEAQAGIDELGNLVQDHLSGVRIIRAFNRSEHERQYFEKNNKEVNYKLERAGKLSSILTPSSGFIVNIAIFIVLYLSKDAIKFSVLTPGSVVALINYLNSLLQGITVLTNLLVDIPRVVTSSKRITEILDSESEIKILDADAIWIEDEKRAQQFLEDHPHTDLMQFHKNDELINNNILVADSVYFRYGPKAEYVLENIDLKLKQGQSLGVMGQTGAGKTTLARLLQRFYDPVYGRIYLDAKDLRSLSRSDIVNKIAYVPQNALLFTGTIKDNLSLALDRTKLSEAEVEARIWQALEIAQARDFVEKLPKKLDAKVLRGGKNFSGGQKQRLCIARALVHKANILILDDAASALDYGTEARLNQAIANLSWNPAVIIISQRVRSLYKADEIILLDTRGNIAARGKHEDLLRTSQLYQEIYKSQEKNAEA